MPYVLAVMKICGRIFKYKIHWHKNW